MKNVSIALMIALLVLAVPFVFSFDPSVYLKTGENPGDIAITAINVSSGTYAGSYQWVKIGGADTFLINNTNDSMISDNATVSGILKEYYSESYYPTQAELGAIKAELQNANDTRNILMYGTGMENACRQALVQDLYPCNTTDDCAMSCERSYELCKPSMDADGPDFVAAALDFSLDTTNLNTQINDANTAIDAMTFDNIGTEFPVLEKAVSDYNVTALHLRANKLRDPISSGEGVAACPDCFQYCSQIPINMTAVGQAVQGVEALKARVSSIAGFETTAANIAANTAMRIAYKENLADMATYTGDYNTVLAKKTQLLNRAAAITAKVSSSGLNAEINAVKTDSNNLKAAIDSGNFTGAQGELSAFNSASSALSTQLDGIEAQTGDFEKAYADASDAVVAAEWNIDQNDGRYAKVVELRSNFDDITNSAPYAPEDLANITQQLEGITSDANALIAEGPTGGISSFAGNLAKSMVDNSLGIVGKITPITYTSKKTIAPLIPPLIIAIADTIFLVVVMIGMVVVAVIMKKKMLSRGGAIKFAAIFLVICFVVVVPSYGLYHFIKHRGGVTTLTDFSADLQAAPTVIILEDDSGPASLKACGAQLSTALQNQGKDVTEQLVDANGLCEPDGTTLDQCVTDLNAAVFVLQSSSDAPTAQFSTIYEEEADLSGDDAFYGQCQIAELIGGNGQSQAAGS